MAGIKVNVGANTSEFQRGLDRLAAQTDRFKQSLAKKFSFSDIGKTLLGGFGLGSVAGIASKVVEYYQQAADAARELEKATRGAADAAARAIGLRQSPSDKAASLRKQAGALGTQIGMSQSTLSDLENDPRRFSDNMLTGYAWKESIAAAREELKALQAEQTDLLYQADAIEYSERQRLATLRDQRGALEDNPAVSTGQITELQAAQRELGRLNATLANAKLGLLKDSGPAAIVEAQNAILKQQAVVEGLKAQERQSLFDYSNTPKPQSQLVADSLAKVGGGGRVGVSNPQLSEAKKTNRILTSIEAALKDSRAGLLR